MTLAEGLLLAGAWVAYFALHSALASLRLKRWVARRRPAAMAGYRIFFNLAALILLVPPLLLLAAFRGEPLWQWTGWAWWIAQAATVLCVLGFLWSLRYYDGSEFLGLRQWRGRVRAVEDQERFRISPRHRFVRHPWYSLGLVLIWSRSMDAALLLSAVAISGYFALGSRLEERKLLVYHGQVYEDYRRRVPGLIPRPWRFLSADQARDLVRRSAVQRL